jgi:ubiquinone/menaquinone biosynthesis C-methylase UbiE
MMGEAKKKLQPYGGRVSFFEGDATNLPFPDDSFDIVTCVRLFGHVPGETRIQMLREFRRVSRRWVIVNYFDLNPLIRLKRWMKRDILKTYQGVAFPTPQKTMLSEFDQAGLDTDHLSFAHRYYSEEMYALTSKR